MIGLIASTCGSSTPATKLPNFQNFRKCIHVAAQKARQGAGKVSTVWNKPLWTKVKVNFVPENKSGFSRTGSVFRSRKLIVTQRQSLSFRIIVDTISTSEWKELLQRFGHIKFQDQQYAAGYDALKELRKNYKKQVRHLKVFGIQSNRQGVSSPHGKPRTIRALDGYLEMLQSPSSKAPSLILTSASDQRNPSALLCTPEYQ